MFDLSFYLQHFPPYGDDFNEGMRKAVHGLASGLAARGVRVQILCENQRVQQRITSHRYSILSFSTPRQRTSFHIAPGLKAYIESEMRSGLVVLNGIFHPGVYAVSRLLRRRGIPYVAAPHDPYHPNIFRWNRHLKWPYWYLFEQRLLREARAVQVLDQRHLRYLDALGIDTPSIAIPNGFFQRDFPSAASLTWRKEGPVRVMFLGRMDAYNKGLDLLLSGFARFRRDRPARLIIQGPDHGDRSALERRAQALGIADDTCFRSADFSRSPVSLIADSDIVCVPSRYEGFSLTALEAMVAGRVLLVSEIAGIAPHVQESGCGELVAPEAESVADGLRRLVEQRASWREMGLRGQAYVAGHLQWEQIAPTALDQYAALIGA
jgi:glycosyltransferase involved in cell wall biosynthesis